MGQDTGANMKTNAIVLPLATSVLFAGSFIAAKYTTIDLQPLTTVLLRYIIALCFLLCLLPKYGRSALRIHGADWWKMVLLGLFGIVGYHYFFFASLHYTAVANTAIINAFSPVVTGMVAAVFIRERLSRANYAGVLLACAGVLLLISRGDLEYPAGFQLNRGDVLMLCAVLCWAVYAVMIKRLIVRYTGFTLTLYAAFCGVVLLFFLVQGEYPVRQIRTISAESIIAVLYMGVGASGLGYLFYNFSIEKLGPTRTSSLVYSQVPILVALMAYFVFGEPVTGIMWASIALIIAGIQFVLRPKSNPPTRRSC
jgi:drug/metabolite transporter (DMT)-like permease